MNKKVLNYLKLGLGLAIIVYIIYIIGLEKIYETLLLFHWSWLPLVLIFFFSFMLMSVYNIEIMLRPWIKVRFWRLTKYFSLGWTSSLFLPGKTGDFSIAYFLKEEISMGVTGAAIFLDKLITVGVAVLIGLAGLIYFFGYSIALEALVLFLVLAIMLALLLSKKSRQFIRKYILRKYAKNLTGFSDTLFSYFKTNRKYVYLNCFWTIVKTILTALFGYFIFLGLGTSVNPLLIMLVTSAETVVMLLPFTTNGLGIRQGVAIYLFTLLGVAPAIVAARYVIGLVIKYAFGLIVVMFVKEKS